MSQEESTTPSPTDKPPFMAFVSDVADFKTLRKFAGNHDWSQSDVRQGDIKTATEFLKNNPSPVLLVVDIPSAAEAPALLDALANVCDADTKVITIGSINEYSFYCWLMDIGIFSYLLKPLTPAMLDGAYKKSVEPASAQAKEEKKQGKVIAIIGARGGVGATTISLNLAGVLTELSPMPVTLIDVDSHAGSVALALDIEPSRGLREAMEKPDRIDSLFIERVMIKLRKNLSVLSAEEALHDHLVPHAQAAESLLTELRTKFGVILLDIPRHLTAHTMDFLKKADQIVLVGEPTLLSLRDCLRLCDMIRDTLKVSPPVVVVNRIGMAPKLEMQVADFEKGINAKVSTRILFAPDIFMQVGGDIPAVKMKSHPTIKPLYALATQLVPEVKQKITAPSKKGFSLFKRKK